MEEKKKKTIISRTGWIGVIIGIIVVRFILPSGDATENDNSSTPTINSVNEGNKSNEGKKDDSFKTETQSKDPIELESSSHNENLADYVTSLNSPSIEYEEQEIKIIGIDYGKKGIPSILGIKETSGEYIGSFSVLKGMNSDSKRDAELILFLELQSKKEIEPRSGIAATLPNITVTDDQGDNAKEVAKVPNSTVEVYYQKGESVIAAVGFAVYSDAKSFVISVEGNEFLVSALNYRAEE